MCITLIRLQNNVKYLNMKYSRYLEWKGALFLWNVIKYLSEMFNAKVSTNAASNTSNKHTANIETDYTSGPHQPRRASALCRKSMDAPSLGMWIRELSDCTGLERMTYNGQGKWKCFIYVFICILIHCGVYVGMCVHITFTCNARLPNLLLL